MTDLRNIEAQPNGHYRVRVRRGGRVLGATYRKLDDAIAARDLLEDVDVEPDEEPVNEEPLSPRRGRPALVER